MNNKENEEGKSLQCNVIDQSSNESKSSKSSEAISDIQLQILDAD